MDRKGDDEKKQNEYYRWLKKKPSGIKGKGVCMKKYIAVVLALAIVFAMNAVSVLANTDNQVIIQEDSDYKQYNIRTSYDTRLMAYFENPDSGINYRASYFGTVASYVNTYRGGTVCFDSYEEKTIAQMISALQSATIVFVHSHGTSGCITIGPTASTYIHNYDLNSVNLSNILCIVLLTCNGGAYVYPPSYNMVQTMTNRGASCAVGFINTITVVGSNTYAQEFAYQTMSGLRSVSDAVSYLSSHSTSGIAQYASVSGAGSTMLN